MPNSSRPEPITGRLRVLRLTMTARTRVNGVADYAHDGFGHHFRRLPVHELIVVRHHLTRGKGEGLQKIEFWLRSPVFFLPPPPGRN